MNMYKLVKIFYVVILINILLLEGCKNDLKEKKVEVTENKTNNSTAPIYDLNNDGISDITYKYDNEGYSEFIDGNFDKKIDQISRYNLKDVIINSYFDEDKDGCLETYTEYSNGAPMKTMVDTNNNGIFDLIFIYKNSSLLYGKKFYDKTSTGNENQVGTTYFKFGYPGAKEHLLNTKMTELEFQESSNKKYSAEKYLSQLKRKQDICKYNL